MADGLGSTCASGSEDCDFALPGPGSLRAAREIDDLDLLGLPAWVDDCVELMVCGQLADLAFTRRFIDEKKIGVHHRKRHEQSV